MKPIEVAAGALVIIGVIAVAAFYTKNIVAPTPIIKDNVSMVMLENAMDRVGVAVGSKGDVHQLSCTSKGDHNVTCNAIGSSVYRVSFVTEAAAPAFELTGQRTIDGKLYVNAFDGVPAEIPAREVDRFTSAFNGRATVQADQAISPRKTWKAH